MRLAAPVKAKQFTMPAQEGVRLNDMNGLFPGSGKAGKKDEPDAIGIGNYRFLDLSIQEDQLLTEQGVFNNEVGAGAR